MRQVRRIFFILFLICLLPLVAALVSASIAAVLGCELNEASTSVCLIAGLDIGATLSALFVLGWVSLISLPMMMGLIGLWVLVELWAHWRTRRKMRKAAARDFAE